jgi:hypothetical protein
MMPRLIITNGDAAADRIRAAGIEAEILPWRDVLYEGPVPAGLILEALSLIRAQFLASELSRPATELLDNFAARDAAVRNHGQHERVELWFEHDLYDQLQLVQLLTFFADEGRLEGLYLVQAQDYLGLQNEEALRELQTTARPITPRHFDNAKRAWQAFTAQTPEALALLAQLDLPALPFLATALRRLLLELPAQHSGLSATEENILRSLDEAPAQVGPLFGAVEAKEPARFMSDLSFFRRIDGLAFAPQPLVAGLRVPSSECAQGPDSARYRMYARSELTLTDAGRATLAGQFDHARENKIDRWFGGTHLTPDTLWRRDARDGVIAPVA